MLIILIVDFIVYWLALATLVLPLLLFKGKLEELYQLLKKVPHLSVYKKDEIPRDYHYQYNARILDLVVTADVGWDVYLNSTAEAWGQSKRCDSITYMKTALLIGIC